MERQPCFSFFNGPQFFCTFFEETFDCFPGHQLCFMGTVQSHTLGWDFHQNETQSIYVDGGRGLKNSDVHYQTPNLTNFVPNFEPSKIGLLVRFYIILKNVPTSMPGRAFFSSRLKYIWVLFVNLKMIFCYLVLLFC